MISAKFGLILSCPLVLSSCSSPPVKIEPAPLPLHLLSATPAPAWQPATNGELVQWCREALDELGACNGDKATLREVIKARQAWPAK